MDSLWLILFIPLGVSALWGLVLRAKAYKEVSDKWGNNKDYD